MNEARRVKGRPSGVAPRIFEHAAVVGAGLMGCGIAYSLAASGLTVSLVDRDEDASNRGLVSIVRIADRELAAGRVDNATRNAIVGRVRADDLSGSLNHVEAVIEAVFEDEAVKGDVLGNVARRARPGTLFASNTSTLPISRLAAHLPEPADFLGLHFFAPVERIELVEVVRGALTSDTTLAAALDLVKQLRKIPVVVEDGPGFFTSRVLGAYTGEALTMLAEGVDPVVVDNVALGFGMPVGPLHMADLTGIPVLTMIFDSLAANSAGMSGLMAHEALTALRAHGRIGKTSGGIYEHGPEGLSRWAGLEDLFPRAANAAGIEVVRRRLVYAQSLEAVRALDENVLRNPIDGDIASRLGWRYPLAHGGVFAFIDTIGVRRFVDECITLSRSFGKRFEPPAKLVKMAAGNERFHAF